MRILTYTLPLLLLTVILLAFNHQPAQAGDGPLPCTDGMAGATGYACKNVDFYFNLPLEAMGGGAETGVLGSDIWGWTSSSGNRYALVGLRDKTSFVDVTNPLIPVFVGYLPSHEAGLSDYRDIKVYKDHAFIVGDVPYTAHGMQVFDLTRLETAARDRAIEFTEDGHYDGVGYGHNMWINEDSGFAYIFRSDTCEAGTHMVNISDPTNPTTAGSGDGCVIVDGADSDAECVTYSGPDTEHVGKEICFIGSDNTAGIADVSDKDNPLTIANFTYPNIRRAHQGVLTADQRYWLISDTMDEMMGAEPTTNTVIIDISDLDDPQYVRREYYSTFASDHNIYVKDGFAYMTNWRAGFRVADMGNFGDWEEVAYFDTHPESDSPGPKHGAWSHYEAFDDGTIIVNDVERGLFILKLTNEALAVTLSADSVAFSAAKPVVLLLVSLFIGTMAVTSPSILARWRAR